MRPFLTLIALLIGGLAFADHLGQSDAAILKMGRWGWVDYYYSKQPKGTIANISDAAADRVFGDVLKRRNNRAIARLPASKARAFRAVRELTYDFNEEMYAAATVGGFAGFLWPFQTEASRTSDVEEMVWKSLNARRAPPKLVTIAVLERQLKEMDRTFIESAKLKSRWGDPQAGRVIVRTSLAILAKMKALFRELSTASASCVLAQMLDAAIDASEFITPPD